MFGVACGVVVMRCNALGTGGLNVLEILLRVLMRRWRCFIAVPRRPISQATGTSTRSQSYGLVVMIVFMDGIMCSRT
jgi:hypothetical protein